MNTLRLSDYKDKLIHFIGIGGSSMSGLAELLTALGYQVRGDDRSQSHAHLPRLFPYLLPSHHLRRNPHLFPSHPRRGLLAPNLLHPRPNKILLPFSAECETVPALTLPADARSVL